MYGYCNSSIYYFMFFFLSSPLPCQTPSNPLFNAKRKKKPTIATNQPAPAPAPPQPTHYNINLIQKKSTQN